MEKKKLYQLKSEANLIDPILKIGKNGVTDTFIEELNKQIKSKKLVKIRVLKSAEEVQDLESIAEKIARATRSTLIDVRGRSVVLYR